MINDDSYILHYGVKGMKWGVRRYQNDDGSLTSLGKRREELQNAKLSKANKRQKRIDVAYATREFNKEKTRQRIQAKDYKKTKRQLANEKKFQDQGFTKDEAEIMAANRRRGVKIALAVGGVTIAALGAYALYKHHSQVADRLLKEGSELGRVAVSDDKKLHDVFYAFRKGVNADRLRYEGRYAESIHNATDKVFRKTIKATSDIKVASDRSARRILGDILKNDKQARENILHKPTRYPMSYALLWNKAQRDIEQGRYDSKNIYDMFNIGLAKPYTTMETMGIQNKFFDALKKHGYGAIRDLNDVKYSGYGSKDPLIFFDTAKVATTKVSELPYFEIANLKKKSDILTVAKAGALPVSSIVGSVVASNASMKLASRRIDEKMVAAYRKEHPKSEMTDSEILKSLGR